MFTLKTFYYQIPEIHISNPIFIDIDVHRTISDLERKIESDLQIPKNKLKINDLPPEKRLEKVSEFSMFNLSFKDIGSDFTFSFKDTSINLNNCDKMNFYEIINAFRKKGLYFSKECMMDYVYFTVFGQKIPKIEFPLLAVPKDRKYIDIKVDCETITLNYGYKKFIFCEKEPTFTAYDYIRSVYDGCSSVTIVDDKNVKVHDVVKLEKFINYNVRVDYKMIFKSLRDDFSFTKNLDFLTKVSQCKEAIAKQLSIHTRNVSPYSVKLYNSNKEKIFSEKTLKSIQNFKEPFYYDIDDHRTDSLETRSFLSSNLTEKSFIKTQNSPSRNNSIINVTTSPSKYISTTPNNSKNYSFNNNSIFSDKKKKIDSNNDIKELSSSSEFDCHFSSLTTNSNKQKDAMNKVSLIPKENDENIDHFENSYSSENGQLEMIEEEEEEEIIDSNISSIRFRDGNQINPSLNLFNEEEAE